MRRASLLLSLSLLALLLASCARADFNQPADVSMMESALSSQGLQICAAAPLTWTAVPGFVEGEYFEVDTNCGGYDPANPGARMWVVVFSSRAARDAALRNFEGGRRLKSPSMTWTKGPLLVVVDGPQSATVAAALKLAISGTGAQ